jgi:hypothetical protein
MLEESVEPSNQAIAEEDVAGAMMAKATQLAAIVIGLISLLSCLANLSAK